MKLKRIFRNKVFPFFAGMAGLKTKLKLIPYTDLDGSKDNWIVKGEDPAFLIQGHYYIGWNRIIWESACSETIPLKMYWDRGNGFSEPESQVFSHMVPHSIQSDALIYIPEDTCAIRIDPGEKELSFVLKNVYIKKVTRFHLAFYSFKKIIDRNGLKSIKSLTAKSYSLFNTEGPKALWFKIKSQLVQGPENVDYSYSKWIIRNTLTAADVGNINKVINKHITLKPLISVILPVYNVEEEWLRKCINSVREQLYNNWELCIADDASTKPHIKEVLQYYESIDHRIKVVYRTENGHISEASNSALEIATGEYIGLLDHDDELAINALYENVMLINRYPAADMIYSDEDKITPEGERFAPFFKPNWSPDLLLSQMYTCHFGVYRKSLIDDIGGFRKGYEGSQDYDLVLRLTEKTKEIYHIPKILYHWRSIPESTASGAGAKNYTHYAGLNALKDSINRRGYKAEVKEITNYSNMFRIKYLSEKEPLISIIIPTRNMGDILNLCIDSIVDKTNYTNYEIIIVDNGSTDTETLAVFEKWNSILGPKIKVIEMDIPFNYSKLNNEATLHAKGEYILLLNNDIEVISSDWLDEMVGYAERENTGAVGATLLYPDRTIQHSGVVMGLGGVAGHAFRTNLESDPGYFGARLVNRNCSVVTAACLLVKKQHYFEVGGLEEDLSVAFNDVDFCLKLLEKGLFNVCLGSIQLIHHESKSRGAEDTDEKKKRFQLEIDYMKRKWTEYIEADPYYNPNLSLESDQSYKVKI